MDPKSVLKSTRVGSRQQIACLTLTRPQQANAYTQSTLSQFKQAIDEAVADTRVRAAVVTGAGVRAFCSGADLHELEQRECTDAFDLLSRKVFDLWAGLPWLTIAAVNGVALGGGLELALSSDVRVCSPTARFGFPEAQLGLLPAAGGIRRLARVIGEGRTKEMILLGRELDADTALQWGLVSYVGEDFQQRAVELAEEAASRDAIVIRTAKLAIGASCEDTPAIALEAVTQALLYERRSKRRALGEKRL